MVKINIATSPIVNPIECNGSSEYHKRKSKYQLEVEEHDRYLWELVRPYGIITLWADEEGDVDYSIDPLTGLLFHVDIKSAINIRLKPYPEITYLWADVEGDADPNEDPFKEKPIPDYLNALTQTALSHYDISTDLLTGSGNSSITTILPCQNTEYTNITVKAKTKYQAEMEELDKLIWERLEPYPEATYLWADVEGDADPNEDPFKDNPIPAELSALIKLEGRFDQPINHIESDKQITDQANIVERKSKSKHVIEMEELDKQIWERLRTYPGVKYLWADVKGDADPNDDPFRDKPIPAELYELMKLEPTQKPTMKQGYFPRRNLRKYNKLNKS